MKCIMNVDMLKEREKKDIVNVSPQKSQRPDSAPIILLSDLVTQFVADTEAAAAARESNMPRGPVTGLPTLDKILGEYLTAGLHVLQGAPGCGKTALALQTASDCFYPCLYVTTEMPVLELFRRLIARQTKTFLGKLKTGEVGGREAQRLALTTIENLPRMAFMDGTKAYASVEAITRAAEGLAESLKTPHVLIIIDSLTVWAKSATKGAVEFAGIGEYEIINHGVNGCLNIANYLNAPVLALSHRNRQANRGEGGLHSAKGSGSIEYEAESVLDIEHSDKTDRSPDFHGDLKVKLTAYKNRNGIPNVPVKLIFNGRTQSFREDD